MFLSRKRVQAWVIAKIKKNLGTKLSNIKIRRKQKEPLLTRFLRECGK